MFNVNTLLIAVGLLALLIDIIISAARLRKNRARAGLLNVVLAIAACAMIAFGIASLASNPSGNAAGASTGASVQAAALTATPSSTFAPSATATDVPSLTPVPSDTPVLLITSIAYSSTQSSTMTACTLIANTMTYLRGDPSDHKAAIARIFAGSLLQVMAQSTDKQWWQVKYTDIGIVIDGWVSTQFVSVDSACKDGSVPLVGPTLTPSRTPRPSATPRPDTSSKTKTPIVAVTSCIVTTTTPVSVRSDPSFKQPPVAQIAERTALTADGKIQVGTSLWWHVQYSADGSSNKGWIGGGSVFAEAACDGLPVMPAATLEG